MAKSISLLEQPVFDITRKRLFDFNENNLVSPVEFFDCYDDLNNPTGTLVTVRIKRKLSLPSV
jgi:hypothetical protein